FRSHDRTGSSSRFVIGGGSGHVLTIRVVFTPAAQNLVILAQILSTKFIVAFGWFTTPLLLAPCGNFVNPRVRYPHEQNSLHRLISWASNSPACFFPIEKYIGAGKRHERIMHAQRW